MRYLALLLSLGLIWAQGEGRTIPEGNDPGHPGQPSWCQNTDHGGYTHNCSCKGMTDEHGKGMCGDDGRPEMHGDPKCSKYCVRNKCYCHQECDKPTF